jgi:hypothetical protein
VWFSGGFSPGILLDSGRWAADARFRVEITEIIPFAAY